MSKNWPGPEFTDDKQLLLDLLGFASEEETTVRETFLNMGDDENKKFARGKGKYVSFAWLQCCGERGMTTVQQLRADGEEFFGPDIWGNDEDHEFIACLKKANSVTILFDDGTRHIFEIQEEK